MFCGGHSAGAVFAAMLCLRAKKEYGCDICGIYTFGSPRYGSASFKAKYEYQKLTYSYEHYNDPVPQLPTFYPQFIDIPVNPTDPILGPQIIIDQEDGYESLGYIPNGRRSGCELVLNATEPNYIDIAFFILEGMVANQVPVVLKVISLKLIAQVCHIQSNMDNVKSGALEGPGGLLDHLGVA